MSMRLSILVLFAVLTAFFVPGCNPTHEAALKAEVESLRACADMAGSGFRPIANARDQRFQGKVQDATAVCRGGAKAKEFRVTQWVDRANYWATGDFTSKAPDFVKDAPQ